MAGIASTTGQHRAFHRIALAILEGIRALLEHGMTALGLTNSAFSLAVRSSVHTASRAACSPSVSRPVEWFLGSKCVAEQTLGGNGTLQKLLHLSRSSLSIALHLDCFGYQAQSVRRVASMAARGPARASTDRAATMNGSVPATADKNDKSADFANYFCEQQIRV